MIVLSGNKINYSDNVNWVGHSYTLHEFKNYKIIDSAQEIYKNKFNLECNDQDIMFFSFYPTKPIGGSDGGLVVSNDKDKIDKIKTLSRYGMSQSDKSWERKIITPGWKFYMNTLQAFIVNKNFKKLKAKIEKFKGQEANHKNIAYEAGATKKGLYSVLDKVIRTGSRIAISISEKI